MGFKRETDPTAGNILLAILRERKSMDKSSE